MSFVQTFHVICFLESWAYKLNQFVVEGYECYDVIRKKHFKAFRNSGGIAVFIKKGCYDMFNISNESSESNNVAWIKFDIKPQYWNLGFSFVCGFVYMSPEGTSVHSDENLFYVIENEMACLKRKYPFHKVLIGGDFNAYTNEEPDYIQFDSFDYIFDDFDYVEDKEAPDRKNLDKRDTNAYGRALLDLCKSTGLRILNGRFGKDANIGNFTCLTNNSSSVIDYFVAELDIFSCISDFEIQDRLESIHMPIRLELSFAAINNTSDQINDTGENVSDNREYFRYYLKDDQQHEYIYTLSGKLEAMLEDFLNFIENDQFSNALDKIMECLSIAADGMKKSAQVIKNKTHNLSQPWFDEECACFRSKTLNALRSFRVTRSPESLGVYQNLKKTYKNLINQKKDAYTRKQTFKLEQACDNKNPREFWRFLKSDKCSPSINISTNEWFHYFSNLFNPNIESDTEYAFDEEATIILNEMLDEPITASEIRASVMNLKNGKSPDIDGIPAEFFNVACDKFLPFLEILLNKLYNKSYFPNDWSIFNNNTYSQKGR